MILPDTSKTLFLYKNALNHMLSIAYYSAKTASSNATAFRACCGRDD